MKASSESSSLLSDDIQKSDPQLASFSSSKSGSNAFSYLFGAAQLLFIVAYVSSTTYDISTDPATTHAEATGEAEMSRYSMWIDVHVMIFVGFGFLMTFLHSYGFSALTLNLLVGVFAIQWGILTTGYFESMFSSGAEKIPLNLTQLVQGDFAAGAALISFGAILGKSTPLQTLIMVAFELVFYAFNFQIGTTMLGAADMGGTIFIHTFGAYFGLAVSAMISPKDRVKDNTDNSSVYHSDMFSMIGSLFLWILWPSFVAVLADGNSLNRCVLHTVLSISASCLSGCIMSAWIRPDHKMNMVDVQNATLAGGVAIGAVSDHYLGGGGALFIGSVAGVLSTFGYVVIMPVLEERMNLFDTCGVHNLHGMPGVLGGIASVVSASLASEALYGENIGDVFSEMANGRSAGQQATAQFTALALTLFFAVSSGAVTGWVVSLLPSPERLYHDSSSFEVPDDLVVVEKDEENNPAKLEKEAVESAQLKNFAKLFAFIQVLLIFAFSVGTLYDENTDPSIKHSDATGGSEMKRYTMWRDVHVMIFVGFGFLMTFLHSYGFSALTLNFLVGVFSIQWGILVTGFFTGYFGSGIAAIPLNVSQLVQGDFAAAAALISLGAILGKSTPSQTLIMVLFELVFYAINFQVGTTMLGAADMGGTIFIHTFGAYFGLAVSAVISPKETKDNKNNGSIYHSDMFSMIGTLFLWIFWPSFVAVLADGNSLNRCVLHTVLSISASCLSGCVVSSLIRPDHKMNMVDVQNATLAGGVAIGAVSDHYLGGGGALFIGSVAGVLSTFGYVVIMPVLEDRLNLYDTCGVHNLHGMPGVLGGIASVVSASLASEALYGENIGDVFSEMASGRSATEQAHAQLYALGITLLFALTSGSLTGVLLKQKWFLAQPTELFADAPNFEVPESEIELKGKPDDNVQLNHSDRTEAVSKLFAYLFAIFQIFFIFAYGCWAVYDDNTDPSIKHSDATGGSEMKRYTMWRDVHVMIFVGFGFLMTFLRSYGFSALTLNFLVGVFSIQWGILVTGFFTGLFGNGVLTIPLNVSQLVQGDFAAAAALISLGAILGKSTPSQTLIMVLFELVFYAINFQVGTTMLGAADMGGTIFIHTFGAYFGLAVSAVISRRDIVPDHKENSSVYHSDMFSMIGTLFLWIFWPSFVAVLADGNSLNRCVLHTTLSIAASGLSACIMSAWIRPDHKMNMVDVQNATLAGGVAIGAVSDHYLGGGGALFIGSIAGVLSTFGYVVIMPVLEERMNLFDTCGVHNLHGMPGVLGGLASIYTASVATEALYGENIGDVFSEMANGRSAGQQAVAQMSALAVTLFVAIASGIFTGNILNQDWLHPPTKIFMDATAFEVPEDGSYPADSEDN